MTKQQKIREGIKERLYASGCPSSLLDCEADRLMESLHSQGVVIKVDRPPRLNEVITWARIEPLIEEGK